MPEALERLERELGPHASDLGLARIPPTSEHDVERLARAVAPHTLPGDVFMLLARGGLTPWDHWPGIDDLVEHPLARGYPEAETPWLVLGSQDRDSFQVVLPRAPAEVSPVCVFSTNALFVCGIFPSLRTYFTGFCEAYRLWKDGPASPDDGDSWTVFAGHWWEVIGTRDPYEPIDGLREVLDALIHEEDPTWPPTPTGFVYPGETFSPEWRTRLGLPAP